MLYAIRNLRIGKRFLIINSIIVIGIISVAVLNLRALKAELLEDRIIKTQHIVEAATNAIQRYSEKVGKGEVNVNDAKKLASEAISGLIYEGDNYVWVNDDEVNMIVHPTSQGKNLAHSKDPVTGDFYLKSLTN